MLTGDPSPTDRPQSACSPSLIVASVTARSIGTVIERCVSTFIDCLRFYGPYSLHSAVTPPATAGYCSLAVRSAVTLFRKKMPAICSVRFATGLGVLPTGRAPVLSSARSPCGIFEQFAHFFVESVVEIAGHVHLVQFVLHSRLDNGIRHRLPLTSISFKLSIFTTLAGARRSITLGIWCGV